MKLVEAAENARDHLMVKSRRDPAERQVVDDLMQALNEREEMLDDKRIEQAVWDVVSQFDAIGPRLKRQLVHAIHAEIIQEIGEGTFK